MRIPVRVLGGLPATIEVDAVRDTDETGSGWCLDDPVLLDARGRPAPWIEARMTPGDWDRALSDAAEQLI